MPSSPSTVTSAGRVRRLHADERASTFRRTRCDDLRLQLVEPVEQMSVEREHVLACRRDPDLLHQLDAGDAGIDGRNRRRARLEARSGPRRRVVGVIHGEDVLVGEPAGLRRPDAFDEVAPAVEEAEPRRPEQILEDTRAEKVDAERGNVDGQRADA